MDAVTILVIEDDPVVAELERRRLERAGYRIEVATDAEAGAQRVARGGVNLILLDYSLPRGVTGLEFYDRLKTAGHQIPVIMVTAMSDEATVIAALRAGVRDFVMKSLQYLDYLPEAVERVLNQERTSNALAESECELKHSASLLRSALEATADGLLVVDTQGRITSCNTRFVDMWRIPAEVIASRQDDQAIAFVLDQLKAPDEFVAKVKALYEAPLSASVDTLELKDGQVFERVSQPQILDGQPIGRVWSFRDVTERRRAEERLSYLAHRDALTGLPNRTLLQDRLRQAIVQSQRTGATIALLFLDLDRFKAINDTLGHVVGDLLIQSVAERLTACVRESDTVARFGGDEFTIVLTNLTQGADAAKVAQKILAALSKPFTLGGPELFISTSIGITLFPGDEESIDGLLKNADAAMYRAKEQGRNTYQFYSMDMNDKALERLALENSLRHALERDQFVVHYQPQVDLRTGRICGAEALLRWRHPDLGLISPARFVPIAEETGLITAIGEWVLRAACRQSRAWRDAGFTYVRMSVNLSGRQFKDRGLVHTIERVLQETGLEADNLDLELTESTIMHNANATIATLTELRSKGVSFSIDDFGTGYSSLSYLKRFPVHILKLDPSFVRDVATDATDAAIAVAIIALAHSLHLKVVAEGVETREQLAFLQANGCDEIQGYLFSRPVAADAFTVLLESGRTLSEPSIFDSPPKAA